MGAGVGTEKIDRIKGEKEEWGLVLIFARVLIHRGKEEAQWVMIRCNAECPGCIFSPHALYECHRPTSPHKPA